MNFLYHGSSTPHLKVLEPRKRYTPKNRSINYEAIYATPIPSFAAAHAFPWSSDEGIDLDVNLKENKIILTLPEAFKTRLQISISIYKLSAEKFEFTTDDSTGATWHTREPVTIIEEVKYPTIEAAIGILGGEIIYT